MMNENTGTTENRNPYTIWFVALSFIAPVVLAYVLYFSGAITTYSNHGEILDPVIDVSQLKLKDDSNAPIPREVFTRKWLLISFVGADCDEACNARLYDSRQVHKALGKDQDRVERMIVHLQPASADLSKLIKDEYPNAVNVHGDEKIISSTFGSAAQINENQIYIMDPIGNVMMRFSQEQSKKDIKSDIQKLLKVSQIG